MPQNIFRSSTFFTKKIFGPKNLLVQKFSWCQFFPLNLFGPKFFGLKFFLMQNYFSGLNSFLTHNFLDPNFFRHKICLDPKFWSDPNFLSHPKFMPIVKPKIHVKAIIFETLYLSLGSAFKHPQQLSWNKGHFPTY